MIDFSTLKGLTIPEGVVTQITDASGRVLWSAVQSGDKVILQVEKITAYTYAGETTYTGEQFILLDVYPKTNGTVKVTYGGLTKTITDTSGAAEPNAQQVVFGTFNGVVHDTTPTSGELVIEGNFYAFGCGQFKSGTGKAGDTYARYNGVTAIFDFGTIEIIARFAFSGCEKLISVELPNGIKTISYEAFSSCDSLKTATIPATVTEMQPGCFRINFALEKVTIHATIPPKYVTPSDVTIAMGMFQDCTVLTAIIVPKGCGEAYKAAEGWSSYADKIVEAS